MLAESALRKQSSQYAALQEDRARLPIYVARQNIIDTVRDHDTVVIVGETGSGKTTQIPQYLLECGMVPSGLAITQPRRVAAMTVAKRTCPAFDCTCTCLWVLSQ